MLYLSCGGRTVGRVSLKRQGTSTTESYNRRGGSTSCTMSAISKDRIVTTFWPTCGASFPIFPPISLQPERSIFQRNFMVSYS